MPPTHSPWFHIPRPRDEPALRLFCFAPAGGSASLFRRWHSVVPLEVEVIAVQLPGHGERRGETPFSTLQPLLDCLMDDLLPFLDRPFVMFGHSMGALIAFELTHLLRKKNERLPSSLLLAASRPPDQPHFLGTPTHRLSNRGFISRLRTFGAIPEFVLSDEVMVNSLLLVLRADFTLIETWNHAENSLLSTSIAVFGGTDDLLAPPSLLSHWRSFTTGEVALLTFPGGHFFPFTATRTVVKSTPTLPTFGDQLKSLLNHLI